jgi:hypothetical protein
MLLILLMLSMLLMLLCSWLASVTGDPARGSVRGYLYDVNVPFMQPERHGWDIHALSPGRTETGVRDQQPREFLGIAAAPGAKAWGRVRHTATINVAKEAALDQHERGIHAVGTGQRRARRGGMSLGGGSMPA